MTSQRLRESAEGGRRKEGDEVESAREKRGNLLLKRRLAFEQLPSSACARLGPSAAF